MTTLAFGGVIWSMSRITDPTWMFIAITLTRGLGQSALSVISISLVGKWFQRRVTWAMALYSLLFYSFFGLAIWLVGEAVNVHGWRAAWTDVAWYLLFGMVPVALLLTRNSPESVSVTPDAPAMPEVGELPSLSLSMALRTPAFWIFALATSCFGLVISGIALFNEAIFQELGFDSEVYHLMLAASALIGMVSQFIAGWFSKYWSLQRILAIAMSIYGVSLLWLPNVHTMPVLWMNTVLMGASGGMITVVFFAIWSETYGRGHLGKIQGAAQAMTVLTSALGPWVFAVVQKNYGSYRPILYTMVAPVVLLAIAVWFVKRPDRSVNSPTELPETP
jgi:MFS family permease